MILYSLNNLPLTEKVNVKVKNVKRKVAKLDNEGKIIDTYNSIREANLACGIETYGGTISLVCSGKQEKSYGYKWKFLE